MAKKKKSRKGKTPKEVVDEHIQDEKDVITEEDFKNVEIGANTRSTDEEPLDLPDDKDRPKDEDKDHTITTPWDVIT